MTDNIRTVYDLLLLVHFRFLLRERAHVHAVRDMQIVTTRGDFGANNFSL